MTCRDEILSAIESITGGDPDRTFTIVDVIHHMLTHGTHFQESSIRTHICSRMCSNSPNNHGTVYDDLVRVGPGVYRML